MSPYYESSAVLSHDETYRYLLHRSWAPLSHGAHVLWVMLNPSTADALQDDPTIRRCVSFSKAWGFDRLTVGNLWALRATDPAAIVDHPDPTGPDNWHHLRGAVAQAQLVVAAWGAHVQRIPGGLWTSQRVDALAESAGVPLKCLGETKSGHPRHPLYVKGNTRPVPYPVPVFA